jgi:hypothetical protein
MEKQQQQQLAGELNTFRPESFRPLTTAEAFDSTFDSFTAADNTFIKPTIPEQVNIIRDYPVSFRYQIRGNKILRYMSSDYKTTKQYATIEKINTEKKKNYTGKMSAAAQRRVSKKILCWYTGCEAYNKGFKISLEKDKKKLVFITLTLSSTQFTSDLEVKKQLLKPFIRFLREKKGCRNWLYKCERQKNGRIHFHIIIDKYIEKKEIRETWNNLQAKEGYLAEYQAKYGKLEAPSTEIKLVRNQAQCERYIAKYIAKDDEDVTIQGAVWSSSVSVATLDFFSFAETEEVNEAINEACVSGKLKYFKNDAFVVYFCQPYQVNVLLSNYYLSEYKRYKRELVHHLFAPLADGPFVFKTVDLYDEVTLSSTVVVKSMGDLVLNDDYRQMSLFDEINMYRRSFR